MTWYILLLFNLRKKPLQSESLHDFESVRLDLVDNISIALSLDFENDVKDKSCQPNCDIASSGSLDVATPVRDDFGEFNTGILQKYSSLRSTASEPEIAQASTEAVVARNSPAIDFNQDDVSSIQLSPFVSNTEKTSIFSRMKHYFGLKYNAKHDVASLISSSTFEAPMTIDEMIQIYNENLVNKLPNSDSADNSPTSYGKHNKIQFTRINDVHIYCKESSETSCNQRDLLSPPLFGPRVAKQSLKRTHSSGSLRSNFSSRKVSKFNTLPLQPTANHNNSINQPPGHSILKSKTNANYEAENTNTLKLDSINCDRFMKMFRDGEMQKLANESQLPNLRLQQLQTYYQNIN